MKSKIVSFSAPTCCSIFATRRKIFVKWRFHCTLCAPSQAMSQGKLESFLMLGDGAAPKIGYYSSQMSKTGFSHHVKAATLKSFLKVPGIYVKSGF